MIRAYTCYQEYISNALLPIPTPVLFIQYYKGILAGMRPCETIVLLGELFGSESVSQVYGNIHIFFNGNVQARENLRGYSLCMHACMHVAIVFYSPYAHSDPYRCEP